MSVPIEHPFILRFGLRDQSGQFRVNRGSLAAWQPHTAVSLPVVPEVSTRRRLITTVFMSTVIPDPHKRSKQAAHHGTSWHINCSVLWLELAKRIVQVCASACPHSVAANLAIPKCFLHLGGSFSTRGETKSRLRKFNLTPSTPTVL